MKKHVEKTAFVSAINILLKIHDWAAGRRDLINRYMRDRYTPRMMALLTTSAVGLIWIIMLFIPPYLGVADDGSLYKTMASAGLRYEVEDTSEIYNNYYTRQYLLEGASPDRGIKNAHDLFVRGAVFLDRVFTRDKQFDLRFLALIYGVLYLPAIYLFVNQACKRLIYFSEAALVGFLAVLMFADISYITYFSSLYPEALWAICFFYIVGGMLRLQEGRFAALVTIALAGAVLALSRRQCAVIGLILAAFCLKALFYKRELYWRVGCVCLSMALSVAGVGSMFLLRPDFSVESKYHSMTRGVLFQAADPEKALKEFGIDSSFAVLTNTSVYDYYPLTLADNEALEEGFYKKFTSADIALYYIKKPWSFIRMMDSAVKGAINLRRSFCGNYEKSVGLPPMAQGLFWSGWSNFKERNAPKTIGYLVLLLVLSAYFWGGRARLRRTGGTRRGVMFDAAFVTAGIGISQAAVTIVMSGDAELLQRAFLFGASMDFLAFLVLCELLGKMNNLKEQKEEPEAVNEN